MACYTEEKSGRDRGGWYIHVEAMLMRMNTLHMKNGWNTYLLLYVFLVSVEISRSVYLGVRQTLLVCPPEVTMSFVVVIGFFVSECFRWTTRWGEGNVLPLSSSLDCILQIFHTLPSLVKFTRLKYLNSCRLEFQSLTIFWSGRFKPFVSLVATVCLVCI
jgi:hypothetical protein